MEITKDKITEIFCIIDDFCKETAYCYPIRKSFRFLQNINSHSPMWRDNKSCLVA